MMLGLMPVALLVAQADDLLAGRPQWTALFTPTPTRSLGSSAWTRGHVLLNVLDQVANRVEELRLVDGQWQRRAVPLPGPGTLGIAALHDCLLHLDVNNIYVNSRNFGFDPHAYLAQLPLARTCYVHVAGHYVEDDGLVIDTHGSDVIDPVWQLLSQAYERMGHPVPTCLERDFNIPDLATLSHEVAHIARLQQAATHQRQVA